MSEEKICQEFRLKSIDETRNYFIKEIKQNELTSKNHKKVCRFWNYIEHLITLVSTVTDCVFISAFASLVDIPIGITRFVIGLKICVITAGIKKYKLIIKKKKKKHDKIVLLAKSKLNSIEVLICKALINSNISHDEFVLINNLLKEFCGIKEEIKNSNDKWKFKLYIKTMLSYCLKCRTNTESKNPKVVKTNNRKIMLLSKYPVCDSELFLVSSPWV